MGAANRSPSEHAFQPDERSPGVTGGQARQKPAKTSPSRFSPWSNCRVTTRARIKNNLHHHATSHETRLSQRDALTTFYIKRRSLSNCPRPKQSNSHQFGKLRKFGTNKLELKTELAVLAAGRLVTNLDMSYRKSAKISIVTVSGGVFTEKIALIFKGLPQRYNLLIRQGPSKVK